MSTETGWTATITGVNDVPDEMAGALASGTRVGLDRIGVKGAEIVQEYIRTPFGSKPAAVAFGNLLASVQSRPTSTQPSTFANLPITSGVIIGVSPQLGATKYAAPVETGSRAHMPPSDQLVLWVKKKLDITDEKQAKHVAYAIALKLAKKGTHGHEMFSRALADLQALAAPALEKAIGEALNEADFVPIAGLP